MTFAELVPIGLATVLLGTIHEEDGVQEHQFWLRNDGAEAVVLQQGYASCHCTTIDFALGATVAPGDSTCVTLRFDPRGKGGEFYESGTVRYAPLTSDAPTTDAPLTSYLLPLTLTGTCITSEETLLRQFPIQLSDHLSLSRNRFDLGVMPHGTRRTLYVTLLHWDEDRRREMLSFDFTADRNLSSPQSGGPRGAGEVQHIPVTLTTTDRGRPLDFTVTIDVIVR